MHTSIRHIFILLCVLCAHISFESAYAQSGNLTDQHKTDAIALAQTIFDENLITDPNLDYANIEFYKATPETRLQILRRITMDTLSFRNILDSQKTNQLYQKEAKTQSSERDVNISILNALYIELSKPGVTSNTAADLVKKIQTYQTNSDWFVANRAYVIEAAHNGKNLKLSTALTGIQKARQLIPTIPDIYVTEAVYETNDIIAYLYVLLNNPELSITATKQVVKQGIIQDRNIDGIGHIGNLAYVFEKWRDYETAAKLTEITIALSEKNNLGINSMAYLRYGQSLNNMGEYAKAKTYLQDALKNEKSARVKLSLESQLAISLAGIGDSKGTKESFERFDRLAKNAEINTTGFNKRRLHAQALLAVARGDAKATYKLVTSQLNHEMEQTYKRIGATAQTQLAELENSKQRQEEREAAQKREIALKQNEIDAQQRSVMLLVSLAISLACITLGAVLIAAWRQRTNKTLLAAAHVAEAGDRAKTQFLAVMTHELRTPLNPILGISSLLCEYGETQTLRDQNKIIRDAGNELLGTLNGIIDMSQMESGTLKITSAPTDIHQIVETLYNTYKAEIDTNAIQFTCFIAQDIPSDIMLDSLRIKQSLSNLISNAIKFTEKGRIHIHVTLGAPENDTHIRTLTMIVADTGQGVSEGALDKLFKPFIQADSSMTREHGGAGVGLSVTRGLARLMGGDVTMNSAAGRGSEFTLTAKTCTIEGAEFDPVTNRHSFTPEPSDKQVVDFSPAISIEKLKAQQAERAKQVKQDKKADRKSANPQAEQAHTPVETSVETAVKVSAETSITPDNTSRTERAQIDAVATHQENEDLTMHAFEESASDFFELEQLVEPDIEQELEATSAAENYVTQTTPMPNPYAPAPQSTTQPPLQAVSAPTAPTPFTAPNTAPPLDTLSVETHPEIQAHSTPQTVPQPALQAAPPPSPPTSQVTDGAISHDQLKGLNILVVEDMLANQVVLRALLEPVGCQITMANHGGIALEIMRNQIFDVVLMDIRMPVMDGIETTENIRKTSGPQQNVPIIALTADASAETNAQCLAAGADVFLTKPVIVSELFSSIRFVREKQTRQKPNAALSA